MMADLNSPLFTPPQPSMDKKRVLENVENKYREFIAETLRCLIELKRDLCAYYHSYKSMMPHGHLDFLSNLIPANLSMINIFSVL